MDVASIGEGSKTFWDMRDSISFDNAKVHFSGVGDFEIAAMLRGM
jgi:hypothetical protein